jgi:hypothetical protein
MSGYTIDRSSNWRRQAVEDWLWGLDLVARQARGRMVTAWVSTWGSSPYERLEDMPFAPGVEYPLMAHVNEVTEAGIDLAKRAAADWKAAIDNERLIPILILHDVDKPLMYVRKGREIATLQLSKEVQHGVVGGMLLKELGFSHPIVATVTTHSPKMPFTGENIEAHVLHHADMFSADHAFMSVGLTPSYQRRAGCGPRAAQ